MTDTPPVLTTTDLDVGGGVLPDLQIPATGLTLLQIPRESRATTLALVLAGRMKPQAGTVTCHGDTGVASRRRAIALAGVNQIDTLERLVPVRAVLREQLAWATPWHRRVPRDLDATDWPRLAAETGLDVDLDQPVGALHPRERLKLRIVLARLARPHADILIVDDVDQVKSLADRREILSRLHELAETRAVIVTSANGDLDGLATQTREVAA